MTTLFYDPRDQAFLERRRSRRLYWLDDLGARPIDEARPDEPGFLFSCASTIEDYAHLVDPLPLIRDRPPERATLLDLDRILDRLDAAGVRVPAPRTWRIPLDQPIPEDVAYPVFVRTTRRSWKLGGRISRATTARALAEEAALLRRAHGWDATILAREWLELAEAGQSPYGPIPQEIRTWIVDGRPRAWSFHHLHTVARPSGFPPSDEDLADISATAAAIGRCFDSRLVAADFVRLAAGGWVFLEAGPGSAAGTAHEGVFKYVSRVLMGDPSPERSSDAHGGVLA